MRREGSFLQSSGQNPGLVIDNRPEMMNCRGRKGCDESLVA